MTAESELVVLGAMRTKINKAISHLGLELAGGGRDGVFYFVDIESDTALQATVYVSAMNHLGIKRWIEEAEEARVTEAGNNF